MKRSMIRMGAGALIGALLLAIGNGWVGGLSRFAALVLGALAGAGLAAGWSAWGASVVGRSRRQQENSVASDPHKLRLREEELVVTKELVETADVDIYRERVEDRLQLEIPVYREDVVVEKDGQEIWRAPLAEERVEWHKTPVRLNDVRIRREAEQRTEALETVLRKEVLRVDEQGRTDVADTESPEAHVQQ